MTQNHFHYGTFNPFRLFAYDDLSAFGSSMVVWYQLYCFSIAAQAIVTDVKSQLPYFYLSDTSKAQHSTHDHNVAGHEADMYLDKLLHNAESMPAMCLTSTKL